MLVIPMTARRQARQPRYQWLVVRSTAGFFVLISIAAVPMARMPRWADIDPGRDLIKVTILSIAAPTSTTTSGGAAAAAAGGGAAAALRNSGGLKSREMVLIFIPPDDFPNLIAAVFVAFPRVPSPSAGV